MANTGVKGIDIRQTGTALVFRAFMQTSAGAKETAGPVALSIYELQSDGTLKSYDFNDNTFKTTALTTATASMAHQKGNNATVNTGIWTYALSTLTGFTSGAIYIAQTNDASASPTDQTREFQFGGAEGDLSVTANGTGVAEINADVRMLLGTAWLTPAVAGTPDVNVKSVGGTAQTARDLGNALPAAAPGANGGLPTVDANNNIHGLTPGTGTGQINAGSGKVPATVASGDGVDAATAIARLTAARAGYLDNLNVGGVVASHADIAAINQSASKHVLLVTVSQFEPGETYTVEARTFAAADGSAVNADVTPTLTATGQVSGSLNANLSAATNPATGVYRWTYTPGASPTLEQIRFDLSATINSSTFTLSTYSQTVDEASVVWTASDQSHLTSIFNKLPANNIADETLVINATNAILTAVGTPQQAGSAVTLPAIPTGWITAAGIAASALNGRGDWLLASSYTAPDNTDIAAIKAKTDNLPASPAAVGSQMDLVNSPNATAVTAIQNGLSKPGTPQTIDQSTALPTTPVAGSVGEALKKADTNLDAAVSTRSTFAGGAVASVTAPVTVGTNSDKTGYALSASGLDSISVADPGGVANQTTLPKILVALYRRFFKKSTLTSTQLKTYADDGTTVNTTQAVSDDGVTQTQGTAT